jgi:hypothetical protein
METANNKGESALSVLGIGPSDGPDLLADALENGINPLSPYPSKLPEKEEGKPTLADQQKQHRAKKAEQSFNDIRDRFKGEAKEQYKQTHTEEGRAADAAPASESQAAPPAKPADKAAEPWEGFHSLNDELQKTRAEFAQYTQQVEQQRKQDQQNFQNWLQQQQNPPKPAGPTPQEQYFIDMGIDPKVMGDYRQQILQEAAQQQSQLMAPIFIQQEQLRVDGTYNALKADPKMPRFEKYFTPQMVRDIQMRVINESGLEAAKKVDWNGELRKAYAIVDHAALQNELEAAQKPAKKEQETKEKKQEQQKQNLSKVSKATSEGGASGFSTMKKDIDSIPSRLDFKGFGRQMLSVMSKRA